MSRILPLTLCLAANAFAVTFATHLGSTNPASEFFTAETFGPGISTQSPLPDDGGFPAYRINGVANTAYFAANIPAQVRNDALSQGWKYTLRLRVGTNTNNDGGGGSIALNGRRWDINLRNTGSDTTFKVNGFDAAGAYVEKNSVGKYFLCELVYNPNSRTADLYINGERRITGAPGHNLFAASDFITFGAGAGINEIGTAHFHFVRLEYGSGLANISPLAFANAASYDPSGIAPGEIIVLGGSNLGPAQLTTSQVSNNQFPVNVAATRVLFDNIPAPILYVSDRAAGLVVPYSVAGKSTVQMIVERGGQPSAPLPIKVAPARPALFSANSSGTGPGAILNQDNTLNTPANPAAPGDILVLYGTGEGQTTPAGKDGALALSSPLPAPVLPIKVQFDGGAPAEVLYAGAAPGAIAGLFQINARIPAGTRSGSVPVVVTVGTAASQSGLTVAVRTP